MTAILPTKHATSDFVKGINRGKSQYKELKEESWDDWKYYTMAAVVAHGCEPVTELTYVSKSVTVQISNLLNLALTLVFIKLKLIFLCHIVK